MDIRQCTTTVQPRERSTHYNAAACRPELLLLVVSPPLVHQSVGHTRSSCLLICS